MPVCPKCRIAYLPTESHRCPSRPDDWHVWFAGTVGALAGGAVGFVGTLFLSVLIGGDNPQVGLVALFVGAPLGGLIGFPLGAWLMWRRGGPSRR
jgi:hypothetical protein